MNPSARRPSERLLLPHEALFGAFLLLTWLRFVWVLGPASPEALLYLGLMLLDGWLVLRCRQAPTSRRWIQRLLFHPVAFNVVFAHMKGAIPKIIHVRMDGALQHADRLLVGGNLSLRLQGATTPWLTEVASICYFLFFPYLLFSLVMYFRRDRATLQAFLSGLFSLYAVGFLGYTLVPAAGPWVAMAGQFSVPLQGGFVTRLNDHVVRLGSNGVDVFPSLHCAVSGFILGFDARHARGRFLAYLLPCAGLWFSTLYLRYHYLVDILCGFGLAAAALWLSARFERQEIR